MQHKAVIEITFDAKNRNDADEYAQAMLAEVISNAQYDGYGGDVSGRIVSVNEQK
jgi:hypothetical protein